MSTFAVGTVAPSQTLSLILEPTMITAALVSAGTYKSHMPTWKMAVLGMLGGLYVGLGGQVFVALLSGVDSAAGPVRYLAGTGFSFALVMIVICGAELFTGNCLLILSVLSGQTTLLEMLWDWFVVYFSNFAGCIFTAVIVFGGGINGYPTTGTNMTATGTTICKIAVAKAHLQPHEMFFRGILANICVCLSIMCAISAKSAVGKVFVIIMPIAAFVTSSYEHSIANMFMFSSATLLNCDGLGGHGWYWINLVLCTLGNILGALILGIAYWATNLPHGEPTAPDATTATVAAADVAPKLHAHD